jgi:hypothetical protein
MQSVRSEKGKAEAEKKAQHLEQVGTKKQPTTLNTWAPKKVQKFEQVDTEKSTKFGTGRPEKNPKSGTGGHRKSTKFGTGGHQTTGGHRKRFKILKRWTPQKVQHWDWKAPRKNLKIWNRRALKKTLQFGPGGHRKKFKILKRWSPKKVKNLELEGNEKKT